ncbi:MAG TPA: HD domain-containing protein [Longimicrobiales bacterium]|nr:HD domain-containing protein [Longimicrobiales bacterium]
MPTRDEALQLLNEWVPNPALRNHMKSVEAAVRWYARKRGANEEDWGYAGLLHDLDWEKYPEEHPLRAVDELRKLGYKEEILHAILAHRPDFTNTPIESDLDKHLFACDEITGLITATAYMRPTRIDDLTAKSVIKKMKDKAFARGVSREDVQQGAEMIGVPLDEHIQNVIEAMQAIAGELGLSAQPSAP